MGDNTAEIKKDGGISEPAKGSKLWKVVQDDEEMKKYIINNTGDKGCINIIKLFNMVCNRINSLTEKVNYNYCLLSNIGYGDYIESDPKETLKKYKEKNTEQYEDPDRISYKLYHFTKIILNDKLNRYQNVKIVKDPGDYRFCLELKYSLQKESIHLTGDWIGKPAIITDDKSNKEDKDKCEALGILHTIAGHVFWPSSRKNRNNTVNQCRSDKINIFKTLEVLKNCYNKNFEASEKGLEKAFGDYADYYKSFGDREEGYNNYLDFWDLKAFDDKKVKIDNETDLSKSRYKIVGKYRKLIDFK